MKTKLLCMVLLATMAVSLTACGTSGGSSNTSGEMNASSVVQSTGITITDSAGREVTLEKPLETVVTFNSAYMTLWYLLVQPILSLVWVILLKKPLQMAAQV